MVNKLIKYTNAWTHFIQIIYLKKNDTRYVKYQMNSIEGIDDLHYQHKLFILIIHSRSSTVYDLLKSGIFWRPFWDWVTPLTYPNTSTTSYPGSPLPFAARPCPSGRSIQGVPEKVPSFEINLLLWGYFFLGHTVHLF